MSRLKNKIALKFQHKNYDLITAQFSLLKHWNSVVEHFSSNSFAMDSESNKKSLTIIFLKIDPEISVQKQYFLELNMNY